MADLTENDIIQIAPSHRLRGCLAIVIECTDIGCLAYVTVLGDGANRTRPLMVRLEHNDYKPIGARAVFTADTM
jgi:hypothetical protein